MKKGSSRDRGKRISTKTLTHRKVSSSLRSHGGKKSSSSRKWSSSKSSSSDCRHPVQQMKCNKKVKSKSSSRHPQKGTRKRSVNKKKVASVRLSSPSKRVKAESPKKIRKVVHSPSTASTTTVTSPESRVSSTGTMVTSKSTSRRDRETSAKLKNLSMSNDRTSEIKSTFIKSPPNIVYKRRLDVDIDYLSANWVNEDHLSKLKESKQKEWTEDDKEQFSELSLKETLRDVVHDHAPSELKMVYAVTCSVLSIRASTGFFKNGSKDKDRFEEFIWGHRKLLRHTQERYESPYEDTCITIADFFVKL